MKTISICCAIILCATAFKGLAQTRGNLQSEIALINQVRQTMPVEKLYVQTDKPYYTPGDTLRFKAYLLNGDFLTPSLRSGVLYLELDDQYGQLAKRIMVPVSAGLAFGDIALTEPEISMGSYTLRAYTNWMRNFDNDYIFKKDIYVSAISNMPLVQSAFKVNSAKGKSKVEGKIKLTNLDNTNAGLADMQLRVTDGKRILLKDKATAGADGNLTVNFDVNDKIIITKLAVQLLHDGKNADTSKIIIPVQINRPENTDLQFMPEGGGLVAGIATKIGFKAIGEDGKAVELSGNILNAAQQVIAPFKTLHKGMGSFEFTPQAGDKYTAQITAPAGFTKIYALPAITATGTVLRIVPKGSDSLTVMVSVSGNKSGATYNLLGQSHGIICYTQTVNLVSGQPVSKTIPTSLFATGIVRFSLVNANDEPVNNRQVFVNHHDALQLGVTANKAVYTVRDSVTITLEVKDKSSKPVKGVFSVAVTDDDQVRTDSLGTSLFNNMLLTSDLKGDIDEPGYYFASANKAIELDNLMLTQGWLGYDLKKIFADKPTQPTYAAEPDFMVQGKITNAVKKPVNGAKVDLFSQRPRLLRDTVTGPDGVFAFRGLMPVDTAFFKLTTHNKDGGNNSVNVEILNEFKPLVFAAHESPPVPWYVNSDTLLLNNSITNQKQLVAEDNLHGVGHQLKEVKINAKKIIKGSKHLVEPAPTDQVIDEQEILKAGKMTVIQLLQAKVKSFKLEGLGSINNVDPPFYSSFIAENRLIYFVIDSVGLNRLGPAADKIKLTTSGTRRFINGVIEPDGFSYALSGPQRYEFLKGELDLFTAEDIKGIEIMTSAATAGTYNNRFTTSRAQDKQPLFTFIEITTRSGHGPAARKVPGTYLYKPMAFSMPTQFYSPKYTVKNKTLGIGSDLRSTIYWNPNFVTDDAGKATINFYSADKTANYTLIFEGTDLNGNIGYRRQKVRVGK